ncbi:transglycosylase SLT domain protein [Yersinia ruckeri]|uniref:lytic transglycosylase domain-containing protein n=1 Tax=Yersinia ruckeri TaxID=29486 RepID=UPI0005AC222E|nr:lytic transglycosylase domain-containing protein [Yersinia ruckeri]AJI94148.1 transglycosylase SLT domain protein [Yersinia ruckeri]MCW6566874.1 lytic transglycosylase domain-containing protein [Yersinia ruckeri]
MKNTLYIMLSLFTFLATLSPASASCLIQASKRWNIPPIILEAIINKESSWKEKALNSNKNGSHDFGLMQVNSIHIASLKSAGIITSKPMLLDPCNNIHAGAYLLSLKFKKYGYSWKAVGAYHSETPYRRDKYAEDIMKTVSSGTDFSKHKKRIFGVEL